jgi:hypothetical protein
LPRQLLRLRLVVRLAPESPEDLALVERFDAALPLRLARDVPLFAVLLLAVLLPLAARLREAVVFFAPEALAPPRELVLALRPLDAVARLVPERELEARELDERLLVDFAVVLLVPGAAAASALASFSSSLATERFVARASVRSFFSRSATSL